MASVICPPHRDQIVVWVPPRSQHRPPETARGVVQSAARPKAYHLSDAADQGLSTQRPPTRESAPPETRQAGRRRCQRYQGVIVAPPSSVCCRCFRSADRRPPPGQACRLPCAARQIIVRPRRFRLSAPLPPKAYHCGATVDGIAALFGHCQGLSATAKVAACRCRAPPWTYHPTKAVYRGRPRPKASMSSFGPRAGDQG